MFNLLLDSDCGNHISDVLPPALHMDIRTVFPAMYEKRGIRPTNKELSQLGYPPVSA